MLNLLGHRGDVASTIEASQLILTKPCIDLFPMEAYVIEAPPIHENAVNYSTAELGFYRLGYFVERYKLTDLKNANVSEETPVFGGIESLQIVLPEYVGLPYYPPELKGYMYRNVELREISEVKTGEFIKPQESEHKLFTARVKDDSFQCELVLGKISNKTKVVVTTAIKFHSEYRVYVREGEILNICFYKGNPLIQPNVTAIQAMVTATKDYAAAYSLDVGVIEDGRTALVEMNDFCCLGNYGLKAIEYAKCIADRWPEVWLKYRG